MPEILTESFCERCGTRYTFESATPRGPRLKGLKVVSRGLKNFVMSDDTSMDEAMAAARSETNREATSQQLDAFHKTFNFCMSCRQYTCGNCWNELDGQCLSCAPHLGHEVLPAPFPDLPAGGLIGGNGANGHGTDDQNGHEDLPRLDQLAWPTSDLMVEADRPAAIPAVEDDLESIDLAARLASLGAPVEPDAIEAVVPVAADSEVGVPDAIEAIVPVAADSEAAVPDTEAAALVSEPVEAVASDPEPLETDLDGRAAVAAAQTSDLLQRFRPGQNLDDEIAAFELEQESVSEWAPTPEPAAPIAAWPEPVVAAPEPITAAPAPVVAAEPVTAAPEPVTAAPEPVVAAPEPVVAAPEPVVAAVPELVVAAPESIVAPPEPIEAQPEPVAAAPEPRDDLVAQPTWQIVAPDSPTADGVAAPTVRDAPFALPPDSIVASDEPEWPTQPEWPNQRPAAGLPFLNRPAAQTGGIEALWAESAREVAGGAGTGPVTTRAAGGVQPCVSCGLSLSANARFCRRCGSRQG